MTEQNKSIVHGFAEAVKQRDFATIEAMASPEVVQKWRDVLAWLSTVWPDWELTITDTVAEGEQVWCRVSTQGTHMGEWESIPPTGTHWTNPGVWFVRVRDGKVVSLEWLFDALNHIKQLGATITPPKN